MKALLSLSLASLGLTCITLLACSQGPRGTTAPPTPTSTTTVVTVPHSWEEGGLRITVLEVVPATREHGIAIPEGYRQYTVNFRYQNLLHEDWEPPRPCPGCSSEGAGLDRLELKTDGGNVYEPRFVGGTPFFGPLKPQQEITAGELYIFEIRTDETPVELLGFDNVNSEERLVYVFTLQ